VTDLLSTLRKSDAGSSSAEFSLVLPLLLLFIFGIIDAGRFMWEYNEAAKATQVGARVAIVTNVLSSGLRDEDYTGQTVGGTKIEAGGRIPAAALGTMQCTSAGCSCLSGTCPSVGTFDTTTFNNVIVARMQRMYPSIQASNVQVLYSGSGLGNAGSTSGGGGGGGGAGGATEQMEISPLVTVKLVNMQFTPFTSFLLASIPIPNVATTLTAEDASGSYSN
jgi:Flp pilus assembly protein TadG